MEGADLGLWPGESRVLTYKLIMKGEEEEEENRSPPCSNLRPKHSLSLWTRCQGPEAHTL